MLGWICGGLALILAGTATFNALNVQRVFDKETKLAIGEERIGSVSDELMRRSPALRANLSEFEDCGPNCPQQAEIFERRNKILSAEWRRIYPRLAIKKDWGTLLLSRSLRDRFFEDRDAIEALLGKDALRDKCVPVLGYYWVARPGRKVAEPRLERYVCPPDSASGPPGRR